MGDDRLGPYLLGPNDDENCGIYTGDARELSVAIPDESVDLVLADPPYLKEYLSLYEWLACTGSRILRPGGWLLAYGAAEYLPDYLARMGQYLDFFWVFVLLHNGSNPRMWYKKLMSGYKPAIVYTKGNPCHNPWKLTVYTDIKDKRFHKWGQGIKFPVQIINKLTNPNEIIFDPMCGGGIVPVACKQLGRRYLAFEIDPETADLARDRVCKTQPPLFIMDSHEQVELVMQ